MLGIPYHISEIAHACGAIDLFQGRWKPAPVRYVAYDSRHISFGGQTVFVALRHGHRDGHDFIQDAWKKGVRTFIVSKKINIPGIDYVLVDDTLDSLQRWAMQHRQRFRYPVLAITGSNGKTTVKEWLASLLEQQFQIVKSPGSYNSQLGVALSLLQMYPEADLAIIEAGISRPGEMERLEAMIAPDTGMLTHMGPAHEDGFADFGEKLKEKCLLFEHCKSVLTSEKTNAFLKDYGIQLTSVKTIGEQGNAIRLAGANSKEGGWEIQLESLDSEAVNTKLDIPVPGPAALENALLAVMAAGHLGMDWENIRERTGLLQPVDMRTEIITDNPEVTVINDSYNSDPDSIRNAFALLQSIEAQPGKMLILGDVPHLGDLQLPVQKQLLKEAVALFEEENIITLGKVFGQIRQLRHYPDTEALLDDFDYSLFQNKTILLKAARSARLERLLPYLNRHPNATYMQIDLDALQRNYQALRSGLPEHVRVMAMVKAFSYGSGSWEIASALATAGVEYLSVAYASEGIHLRDRGIQLPIMVNNPDRSSLASLAQYELEPLVFDMAGLRAWLRAARMSELRQYRCHLKFDTGMGRLGFSKENLPEIASFLLSHPDLEVRSIMSHLAASDMPDEDAFSLKQIADFQEISALFTQLTGLQPIRHILNTAGATRFPQHAFDMVRLGLGLYGINPAENGPELEEIASLKSHISQIHEYPAGTSISYGRAQYTERPSRIATVPIGYADGIFRMLGEGATRMLVRGMEVPTFGRVCMDMLMLDVTDVPGATEGDEVVIFGKQGEAVRSVGALAQDAGTIAYEILARISPRVRRVYVRE